MTGLLARRGSWQAIRDEVMRRIRSREWLPGAIIPNEVELALDFGCARATVNRALRDLAAAGVLERRRRAGTRVAVAMAGRAGFDIPVIHRDVEAAGQRYGYRLIASRIELPPAEVAGRMGLVPRELLHLLALHCADGRPHVYEDRWIDPQVVPQIREVDLARISANEWLVQHMPFSAGDMGISAVVAGEAAGRLDVAAAEPLLLLERSTWSDGRAITFVRQYFAPGHRIEMRLAAPLAG